MWIFLLCFYEYPLCVRTQRYGLFFKNQNKLYICIEKNDFFLDKKNYNIIR